MGASDTTEKDWEEHYKELLDTKTSNPMYEIGYEKGREDMINAIKNDLHDRLTEEINNPYQDQELCQGLYYAMQRCDWFLSDDKEQNK